MGAEASCGDQNPTRRARNYVKPPQPADPLPEDQNSHGVVAAGRAVVGSATGLGVPANTAHEVVAKRLRRKLQNSLWRR